MGPVVLIKETGIGLVVDGVIVVSSYKGRDVVERIERVDVECRFNGVVVERTCTGTDDLGAVRQGIHQDT